MITRRGLYYTVLVITAGLLQVTVCNRLPLPVTRPDLLLLVVIAIGFGAGSSRGAVVGFAAGLFADTLPPADHAVGALALVYAVVGYLAGARRDTDQLAPLVALGSVALLSVGAELATGLLGMITGDPPVAWGVALTQLPLFALYDVVLAPLVVPPVSWLARRVTPELDRP